jgi:hypothetical protein
VLLEVLLARGDKLQGNKLEAALRCELERGGIWSSVLSFLPASLEARDDSADEAALDAVGLDRNEAVAMSVSKLARMAG